LKKKTIGRYARKEENVKQALQKLLSKELPVPYADQSFNMLRISIQNSLKIIKSGSEAKIEPNLGRSENIFPEEMETKLFSYVRELDIYPCYALFREGFLVTGIKNLAESIHMYKRFNAENKTAGEYFYKSKGIAELVSEMRAAGFNKPQIFKICFKIRELMEKYSFALSYIFITDERDRYLSILKGTSFLLGLRSKWGS
jgi:hypothetical protein